MSRKRKTEQLSQNGGQAATSSKKEVSKKSGGGSEPNSAPGPELKAKRRKKSAPEEVATNLGEPPVSGAEGSKPMVMVSDDDEPEADGNGKDPEGPPLKGEPGSYCICKACKQTCLGRYPSFRASLRVRKHVASTIVVAGVSVPRGPENLT